MYVPDAINLLSISENWNVSHQTKTTKWLSDYLNWLTKSELGIKGSKQKNNHGSWYKFQVASLAFYLGNEQLAKNTIELAQNSLDEMLNNEGGQIHELTRSRSFFYSCFNLQALTDIAAIGNKVGMNMWQFESKNKKSLSLAINYLTPIVEGKEWNHNTLKANDLSELVPIIYQMSRNYNSQEYKKLLSKILKITEEKGKSDILQKFWLLNSINN